MLRNSSNARHFGILVIVAGSLAMAVPVFAQSPDPILLLLDRNAIAADESSGLSAADINGPIATVGLRDSLPYFSHHRGEEIILSGGSSGSEGWFALSSVPASWTSDDGSVDGTQNFVWAGPGLGSPDSSGNRSAHLISVPGVVALGTSMLAARAGQQVCGVVFDQVLSANGGSVDLSGANLGRIGLQIVAAAGGQVQIRVLDASDVCSGSFGPAR